MYLREKRAVGLQSKTTGVLIGAGSSSEPISTSIADKNFMQFYTKSTASSGDSRGMYVRHYAGGTGGYADAARIWNTVTGTGYSYCSGAHVSMSLNAGATITGSGSALRATLGAAAATRTMSGNVAALQLDSDIATGNTVPSNAAFIRLTKSGNVDLATFLHVTDDQCLKGSAASGSATNALPVLMPDGSTLYISLVAGA